MAATTPLAWHNLWHNRVRSSVAIAGVTFAIVLMFMQLGFLEAVKISATLIYDALDFDLCLRSPDYNRFSDARSFPEARLHQAAGMQGVQGVTPLMASVFSWRNPKNGQQRAVLALGVEPEQPLFIDDTLQLLLNLQRPGVLLVDDRSRREFGPANKLRFGKRDQGVLVEINGNALEIAGTYSRGAGLSAGGAIMLHRRDFSACAPQLNPSDISLGLIRLEQGERPSLAAQKLQEVLPDDVVVRTRAQVMRDELHHWVWNTNYGLIFQSGVLIAVVVGTAIVYQVLASDVANLMPEYATLKAMGYSNAYIVSVMLQQSVLLAIVSYAIGVLLSQILYVITAFGAQIPVRMTWQNLLLVFALALLMCVTSGLAAVRKAFVADPAELFR